LIIDVVIDSVRTLAQNELEDDISELSILIITSQLVELCEYSLAFDIHHLELDIETQSARAVRELRIRVTLPCVFLEESGLAHLVVTEDKYFDSVLELLE
jgi:hypothetical protein